MASLRQSGSQGDTSVIDPSIYGDTRYAGSILEFRSHAGCLKRRCFILFVRVRWITKLVPAVCALVCIEHVCI